MLCRRDRSTSVSRSFTVRSVALLLGLCLLASCAEDGVSIRTDKLQTKLHKDPRTYYFPTPITDDVRWQLLTHAELIDGIEVAVAYDIIFNNPSSSAARVHISKITLEDGDEVLIGTYEPEGGIGDGIVAARAAEQFTDVAQVVVPSIYDANRIRKLVVWATLEEVTTDG